MIEALQLLRSGGVQVVVAASGRGFDPRHPGHFPAVERRIVEMHLADSFRILGMIPHDHLMALMCASDAVLNPSLSEGWSTTVEEARSLGVPLILSDLAVHREQAGAEAVYFARHDFYSLAEALRTFKPLPQVVRAGAAVVARAAARARVDQFSADFESAVRLALAAVRRSL